MSKKWYLVHKIFYKFSLYLQIRNKRNTRSLFLRNSGCNCVTSLNTGWPCPRNSKLKMISVCNFLIRFYLIPFSVDLFFNSWEKFLLNFCFQLLRLTFYFGYMIPNVPLSKFISFMLSLNSHRLRILTCRLTLTLIN